MVLEAGKLYKKVGDTFVEVNTEDYVAPALTDALELQQASDAPIPTAQAFLTTLALNNLTIQNYSGNVTPTEGDTKQVSDSGQIRFYKYISGAWVEVGGFNGNNLQFKNDGKNNIMMGYYGPNLLEFLGIDNVILGSRAGEFAIGSGSLQGYRNVMIGVYAGKGLATRKNSGYENVLIGESAGSQMYTGYRNVFIGREAGRGDLTNGVTGWANIAIGYGCAQILSSGHTNVIMGFSAGWVTTGDSNVCIGLSAGGILREGNSNVLIGKYAGANLINCDDNVAIGKEALQNMISGFEASNLTNAVGIGAQASVSGNNQVQLGNSSTTTYVYGTVQNRSDRRDKADIRDTELGLAFILELRPVDYKWDLREDYITRDDGGNVTKLPKDGSKKRSRYHHGFISQEVKEVIDKTGKDFGGFQDHSVNGGNDVQSIGYDEFVAPMVKAMQEMYQEMQAMKEEIITLRERVKTLEGVSE